jgi:hypothetical protein
VSWMCGLMRVWAASTEARVREEWGTGEGIVANDEETYDEWGAWCMRP